jgi:uncharacterized protein
MQRTVTPKAAAEPNTSGLQVRAGGRIPTALSRTQLIVFVRAPRPGFVKTRLAAGLGADAACAAYRALVDHLLPKLELRTLKVELRFTPDDAADELAPWLRPGWQLRPQGEGDLGARLERAVAESLAAGFSRCLIIGTDCPYLTATDLNEAETALATHDVVLGPAVDGGYWLIGLRTTSEGLFRDIPWSTGEVLAATLKLAQAAGLKVHLLRTLEDIDTAADWARYQQGRQIQS